MITIPLSTEDLTKVRIAPSPLWETVASFQPPPHNPAVPTWGGELNPLRPPPAEVVHRQGVDADAKGERAVRSSPYRKEAAAGDLPGRSGELPEAAGGRT